LIHKKLWLTCLTSMLLSGAIAGAHADSTLTNVAGTSAWVSPGISTDNGYFTTFWSPYLSGVPQDLSAPSNVTFGSFDILPTFISGSKTDGFTMPANTSVTFFFNVNGDSYEAFGTIHSSPTSITYNYSTFAGSSDSAHVSLTELLNITTSASTTNTSVVDPGTGNTSLNLGNIYVDTVSYGMPNPFNGGTSVGGFINAVPEMGTSASMVSLLCGSGLLGLVTRKRARSRA